MAEETTSTPRKPRAPRRPLDDEPAPPVAVPGVFEDTEDRTRIGWPGASASVFVPHSYYEQFPARFRPRFETSAQSENMSRDDLKKIETGWTQPNKLITIVNCSDKDNTIAILGMTPGEIIHVKVPAYGGVIRGPLDGYLHTGISGSKFSTFLPIGPSHAALSEPASDPDEKKRRAYDLAKLCTGNRTKKLVNGETLCACMLYECPVEGHSKLTSSGELQTTLSLRHAQYLIEAIGQTLTAMDAESGEEVVLYTPELDACRDQIDKFIPLDDRPDSFMFATNRKHVLELREREIADRISQGKFSAGR